MSLVGMEFDSKCKFAPPTILLGRLLCPWTWGISFLWAHCCRKCIPIKGPNRARVSGSHASKIIFNILQARLQQYVNLELPDVQAGFRKGRGNRDQIANMLDHKKKQESSRKTSISVLLTMPKPLTVWITINCGKF